MDGGAGNFDISGAASEGKEEEGGIREMIATHQDKIMTMLSTNIDSHPFGSVSTVCW